MRQRPLVPRTLVAAVVLAGALALLAGCSQSPTAPMSARQPAPSMGVNPDQRWSDPTPGETPPPTTPDAGSTAGGAESSRALLPLFGGTVSAGQFKVVVPPGALREPATVTVRQPHLDQRVVVLSVSPASANGFLVPVLLVADCADMNLNLLNLQTIYWWNPTLQRWEAMLNVQINLLGHSVSAPLWHFSTYKVGGKAGW